MRHFQVTMCGRQHRAPNIMKHTLRCHGFGDARQTARSGLAMGMHRVGSRGPKPRQPTGGCGQNRRHAEAWSRGPACGDATAQACTGPRYWRAYVPLRGRIQAQTAWNLLHPPRDLCREACQYSKYWLHLASRYRRFWLATHARFIMLGAHRHAKQGWHRT